MISQTERRAGSVGHGFRWLGRKETRTLGLLGVVGESRSAGVCDDPPGNGFWSCVSGLIERTHPWLGGVVVLWCVGGVDGLPWS